MARRKYNTQNLIPGGHKLTKEEASKGGKASVKARREKKLLKEEILKRMSESDWEELVDNAIARAKDDDTAFKTLRDTIGQKPVEKIEVAGAIDDTEKEMEAYLNEFETESNPPSPAK